MRIRSRDVMVAGVTVAAVLGFWLTAVSMSGQAPAAPAGSQFAAGYRAPRTTDGHPDLNGIYQSFTTANWDIEAHPAGPAPHSELMGAYGAQPGGQSIVEGGTLPYKPEALKKKQENFEKRLTPKITNDPHRFDQGDPEIMCFRPGVPRANYMPYPFQIFQTPEQILMVYEFKGAVRTIYMNPHMDAPGESWMGWSNGHWEGETLVVEATDFNDHTWLDRAGNYHSDALKVTERYTPVSPHHLMYEATIDDSKVFTRPWKMTFPLYRRMEQNVQLVEFNCVPFVEELLYTPLGLYKSQKK
jgi:hypothetical protein